MSNVKTFYELKETAKWSLDPQERKTAIKELSSSYGEEALSLLEEIMIVTAYEDVKAACLDAIRAIQEKEAKTNRVIAEEKVAQSSSSSSNDSVAISAADSTNVAASTTSTTNIASKKKEKQKSIEGEAEKKAAEVTTVEAS